MEKGFSASARGCRLPQSPAGRAETVDVRGPPRARTVAAAGRESRMWSQVRSPGLAAPAPLARSASARPSPHCPHTPGCRLPRAGLQYSRGHAMPARARRRFNLNQVLCARALAQGCGRRPAASGTTAWARRRPGGGESARTSRPLTTRRFAATGLSHSPHPLPTLAALLCFVRTASPILHAVEARCGAQLCSVCCAASGGSRPPCAPLTCVWLDATQSSKQTSTPLSLWRLLLCSSCFLSPCGLAIYDSVSRPSFFFCL